MKKSDKKIENQLRNSLHEVCENALSKVPGFTWLTHDVDYNRWPQSLIIVCVFQYEDEKEAYQAGELSDYFSKQIAIHLLPLGIKSKQIEKCLFYDSEQMCDIENNGNWARRIASFR